MTKSGLKAAVALAAILGLSACDGIDSVEVNAPLLDAVGLNLTGKPKPEPDLPDRAPLVVPPTAEKLPEPGERPVQVAAAANGEQWPQDPDLMRKEAEERAAAERREYCKNGNWSKNANIDDFRRNSGIEARCRPEWIENVIKAREAQAAKTE